MEILADTLAPTYGPPAVPVDQAVDQILGLLLSNGLSGVVIIGLAFFAYKLHSRIEILQDRIMDMQKSTIESIDQLSDLMRKQ